MCWKIVLFGYPPRHPDFQTRAREERACIYSLQKGTKNNIRVKQDVPLQFADHIPFPWVLGRQLCCRQEETTNLRKMCVLRKKELFKMATNKRVLLYGSNTVTIKFNHSPIKYNHEGEKHDHCSNYQPYRLFECRWRIQLNWYKEKLFRQQASYTFW